MRVREIERQGDIGRRAARHDQPQHRPVQAHQHHRPEQDGDGGQQRQQQRVVQRVERPHAARDLAHDRAGEAVGVPVGREALDPVEGVLRDIAHHPQRQRDDAAPAEMAQDHHAGPQRHHGAEGGQGRVFGGFAVGGHQRQRIDQLSGEERHEDIGKRGRDHGEGDPCDKGGLAAPVAEREGENGADRIRPPRAPPRGINNSHEPDRRSDAPAPIRIAGTIP